MCGAVWMTTWRWELGSVSFSWWPVMPVLNTASPKVSPSAPYDVPRNVRPSSRTSSAGRSVICAVLSVANTLYDDPCAEDDEDDDRDDSCDRAAPGGRS